MKIRNMMAALVAAIALSTLPALATTQGFSNTSSVTFETETAASTNAVTVSITSTSSSGACTVSIYSPTGGGGGMTWAPASNATTTTLYVGNAGTWTITATGCTITGSVSFV